MATPAIWLESKEWGFDFKRISPSKIGGTRTIWFGPQPDPTQVVMGWTDSHLHQFEKDDKNWGVPEWDEFDEFDLIDERKTTLAGVLKAEGDTTIYQYDFGDDWQHQVLLEKTIPVNAVVKTPTCLGGDRRCPPEDVGGASGYDGGVAGVGRTGSVLGAGGFGDGAGYFPHPARGIVVVRMKDKVMQFPQQPGPAAVPTDQPLIIFSLGGKRVAIQWTVTALPAEQAEVIPIQIRRQRKDGNAKRQI